jgi:guanylate kinase
VIRRRGTLFVVSAPSGAGKTTLCREIRLRVPDLAYSVSVTTRPPRPGEMDGIDFRFVGVDEFRAMLDRRELAEWATCCWTSTRRAPRSCGSAIRMRC